jgi:hypothetical protein
VLVWVRADGEDFLIAAIWYRRTFVAALVVLSVCSRAANAEPPPAVTFTRVADTNMTVPYGAWKHQSFKSFDVPVIDRGDVAFLADAEFSGVEKAPFNWEHGELGVVADPSTPRPGGGPAFSYISGVSVRDGEYAFGVGGLSSPPGAGVYRTLHGTLVEQANTAPVRPRRVVLDESVVWFNGVTSVVALPPRLGVYRASEGSVATVAFDRQPNPAAPAGYAFSFDPLNPDYPVVAIDGVAVFWAPSRRTGSPDMHGLYRYRDGDMGRIADSTMPQFSGGIYRNAFDYDGHTVAFGAAGAIYVGREGSFVPVAMDGQPTPDGETFALANDGNEMGISVDAGRIAFTSVRRSPPLFLDYYTVLYSDVGGGSLQRIIGTGDVLFGQLVYSVVIGPDALSGNQIAFWVRFTDGTTGVYIATVPEPATSVIGIPWLAATLARLRRRRKP